ncbi:glycosyl transferase [Alphaproteobacteria bacterium]|nr:glycosyl transferase [Alphaproteobacteria bacterium]
MPEAIESVLNQTRQDFEIIVVNDGSTDEAGLDILRNRTFPKTTVLHQTNKGVSAARNAAIRAARGKYIIPLDADDKFAPDYLAKAAAILEENQKVGIVYAKARYFGSRDDVWNLPPFSIEDFLFDNCIHASSMFRKSDWEQVGGYDESLHFFEDFEFYLSLLELEPQVVAIPEILFFYRQHNDSKTKKLNPGVAMQMMVDLFAYALKKHAKLYSQYPQAMAVRIVRSPPKSERRVSRFKLFKYNFLLKICALLAHLPFTRVWALKKKEYYISRRRRVVL